MQVTLTIQEAAAIVKLHPETIHKWIRQKKFPHTKVGGRYRVNPASLDAWLKRREDEGENVPKKKRRQP